MNTYRKASKRAGRPRKQLSEKSRPKTLTLPPLTLEKIEALRRFRISIGDPPPPTSWMADQGLKLYFEQEQLRFPELRSILTDVESTHAQATRKVALIPVIQRTDESSPDTSRQ